MWLSLGISKARTSGGMIAAGTISFALQNLFSKKLEQVIRRRRKNASTF